MGKTTVVDSAEIEGMKIEVLQYNALDGTSDARAAERLFFTQQAGMRLKFVRLTMQGTAARQDAGNRDAREDGENGARTGSGVGITVVADGSRLA